MSDDGAAISSRKDDHIALCETDQVAFQAKTNLLDDVGLVHDALPEMSLDQVDLTTQFAGRTLRAPLIIAAMTGGSDAAEAINRDLAKIAQKHGVGFGFGSQRPLLQHGVTSGYRVRDLAPDVLILGNIGIVQARETPTAELAELVAFSGADALCVHLNPAMEIVQKEGDRDFRGGLATLTRLIEQLAVPIVVKETGCGLSRSVGRRLAAIGVKWVDTSGAGGTSWVGVETLRAPDSAAGGVGTRELGEAFWDWGIPTAASVVQLADLGMGICATGGVSNGLQAARAIALGATCAGMARPFLQARARGGLAALDAAVGRVVEELRLAMLLTGSRTPVELQTKRVVVGSRLSRWIPAGTGIASRSLR
jgi:isopentenyl-diphosphate delta-isomerase